MQRGRGARYELSVCGTNGEEMENVRANGPELLRPEQNSRRVSDGQDMEHPRKCRKTGAQG